MLFSRLVELSVLTGAFHLCALYLPALLTTVTPLGLSFPPPLSLLSPPFISHGPQASSARRTRTRLQMYSNSNFLYSTKTSTCMPMPELIFLECSFIEVRVLFNNWSTHQHMCSEALLFVRSIVRYEGRLPLSSAVRSFLSGRERLTYVKRISWAVGCTPQSSFRLKDLFPQLLGVLLASVPKVSSLGNRFS